MRAEGYHHHFLEVLVDKEVLEEPVRSMGDHGEDRRIFPPKKDPKALEASEGIPLKKEIFKTNLETGSFPIYTMGTKLCLENRI